MQDKDVKIYYVPKTKDIIKDSNELLDLTLEVFKKLRKEELISTKSFNKIRNDIRYKKERERQKIKEVFTSISFFIDEPYEVIIINNVNNILYYTNIPDLDLTKIKQAELSNMPFDDFFDTYCIYKYGFTDKDIAKKNNKAELIKNLHNKIPKKLILFHVHNIKFWPGSFIPKDYFKHVKPTKKNCQKVLDDLNFIREIKLVKRKKKKNETNKSR